MKHTDTDNHTPAPTHLQHFTLIDKQHTRTPTCPRESTLFCGLFNKNIPHIFLFLYASLICLYLRTSSEPPTSIIVHMVTPEVSALMQQKLSHTGDTMAQYIWVCVFVSAEIDWSDVFCTSLDPFFLPFSFNFCCSWVRWSSSLKGFFFFTVFTRYWQINYHPSPGKYCQYCLSWTFTDC